MLDDDRITLKVEALFRDFLGVQKDVGGGEGVEGIYGTIRQSSLAPILSSLFDEARGKVCMVDVGGGLAWPLIQACAAHDIQGGLAIECDFIKVMKGRTVLERVAGGEYRGRISYCQANIEDVRDLEGWTHAYSFWEGINESGKAAFGRLFAESSTMERVAVVQSRYPGGSPEAKERQMLGYGFGPVRLVYNTLAHMSGGFQRFHACVFAKVA